MPPARRQRLPQLGLLSLLACAAACTDPGRLVGMRWDGAAEEVLSIDLVNASDSQLGLMGNLELWQNQTAISPDGGILYALGITPAGVSTLYSFDLDNDAFLGSTPQAAGQENIVLAGFDANDRLIGMRWNGASEDVLAIDVVSATGTVLGQMGDLESWQSQTAISPDGATLYAFGNPPAGANKLYSFDLDSDTFLAGQTHAASLDGSFLAGFDVNDRLIGMRWNGAQEDILAIDESNASASVIGQMGDLELWQGQTAISRDGATLYALGLDAAMVDKLYSFDLGSDSFLSATQRPPSSTATMLAGFGNTP